MKPKEFSNRLWDFAARIGKVVDALPDTRLGRHVAGQLVRCGTSSAPNYDEGCAAESRDDFAHKLSVATKEMRETLGWLSFSVKAELLAKKRVTPLIDECEQLLRMLSKSVVTAKRRPDLLPTATLAISNQHYSISNSFSCQGLDHIAIVVPDTDAALKLWRDKFGFRILFAEDVNDRTVRLTHLDLGNAHLQLVQPLTPEHALHEWLRTNGTGLHHFCLRVDKIEPVLEELRQGRIRSSSKPHQGTRGKRALFLDSSSTGGVRIELTGS
jgi:methylmalonyl-CoA/ethylmalonyl-CoA epimerase